jgi:hypothetical protein
MPEVLVAAPRLPRWVDNFETRHGAASLTVRDGALGATADDGSMFTARLPLGASYDGPATVADLVAAVETAEGLPRDWGVLLVRRGGFAIARLRGTELAEHKIGQRHVQGRTKAGGQSQQRFARRRDNQARQAFEAAAGHAARILAGPPLRVVTGGDRAAVEEVLADRRLQHVTVVPPWLAVPDPRRSVLDAAVLDALAVRVDVVNT